MLAIAISLLKSNWKPILIGLAIVVYSLFWYNFGKATVRREWDKSIVEAVVKSRQIEADNVLIGNKVGGYYETDLAKLGADFNDVLIELRSGSGGGVSTEGNSPRKPDASACYNGLPNANKEALAALAYTAQKQALQLIRLQEWERSVK